jgi:hypothetical protein
VKGGRSLNLKRHPIRFKSYSRVLHILRSCTSPGVRLYIYPSTLYMFGLSTGLIPSSSNFHSTSKLSYYFYIINTHAELQISCVFAFFFAMKTSKNACIIRSECTFTHTYCCVSKLFKFGAYLYAVDDNTSCT